MDMRDDTDCIWFCRHGETVSNLGGWLAGSLDVPLTETGRHQAMAAARTLQGEPIERIFSSPLSRAIETARIISERLHIPVVAVPELAERHWGDLEGKAFPSDLRRETVPGGESLTCFYRRVAQAMESIPVWKAGGVPLIVAHAGTGQAIQHLYGLCESESISANAKPYKICRRPPT